MRIERSPLYADIVGDSTARRPVYHCIVQRHGSAEILAWYQEETEESAILAAHEEIDLLQAVKSKIA